MYAEWRHPVPPAGCEPGGHPTPPKKRGDSAAASLGYGCHEREDRHENLSNHHYDGSRDGEEVIVQIMGMGAVKTPQTEVAATGKPVTAAPPR